MLKTILLGLFRHLLTVAGGAALATGYITADDAQHLATEVPKMLDGNTLEYIGGAATILGAAASALHKVKAHKAAQLND